MSTKDPPPVSVLESAERREIDGMIARAISAERHRFKSEIVTAVCARATVTPLDVINIVINAIPEQIE